MAAAGALRTFWEALDGAADLTDRVAFDGDESLPSVFAVTDFAAASIGAAALAAVEYASLGGGSAGGSVVVDRRLASLWFLTTLEPLGWELPPVWDVIAGDYATGDDGWIRLHTNARNHRAAALSVLGCEPVRDEVARAVARWNADELEHAVVAAGGCAATMRSSAAWRAHPQGSAVAREPVVASEAVPAGARGTPLIDPARPLAGVRVLDLTRILAGPIATRFLAGLGADVVRVDPPGWEEPVLEPEVTLGKRTTRLDLAAPADRDRFLTLLASADVFVHGYRPGALDALGLGAAARRDVAPGVVDVALDAYGWTGPWSQRRGFDSLVQMSAGIANEGMVATGATRPHPLPAQALDHATGYLIAATVLRGLTRRVRDSVATTARLSLARTAWSLLDLPRGELGPVFAARPSDYEAEPEHTPWGPARRACPPVKIPGIPLRWDTPAVRLGTHPPAWTSGPR